MYVPKPYEETRHNVLVQAIEARSFGTLITYGANGIALSHVPFVTEQNGDSLFLLAHVARANPQWHDVGEGAEAVASFVLDDAYISPSWYPTKAETGKAVPTWNYVAVEARCSAVLVESGPELFALVEKLTQRHESNRPEPWSTADAPPDFTAALLRAIVGIRLEVKSLKGAWKLDQKKPPMDRSGAALGLRFEQGGQGISELMLSL
jgi:transcriptional regulator